VAKSHFMAVHDRVHGPAQNGIPRRAEVYEGWMQTGQREVYVGSRLKPSDAREGAI
jgi:hypothetical protein